MSSLDKPDTVAPSGTGDGVTPEVKYQTKTTGSYWGDLREAARVRARAGVYVRARAC
jgi:hypothetical protein